MGPTVDFILLERYVADECTPEERRSVDAWLAADRGRQEELEAIRQTVAGVANARPADVRPEMAMARLNARLDHDEHAPTPTISRRPSWIPAVAAFGLAALVLAIAIRHPRRSGQPVREYVTHTGQRETITLADGTRLTLAPESRLRVDAGYGAPNRSIVLEEGEAYFAVVHDPQHPFAVQTRTATVNDIGTEFDIRAYQEDSAVRIAVARGRVDVQTPLSPSVTNPILSAGDMVMVGDKRIVLNHHVDLSALTAWRQGTLVFEDTPLPKVLHEVERAYDIQITLADTTLSKRHVTATFTNIPLSDVLELLAHSVGAQVQRDGKKVTLTHVNRADRAPAPLTTADATDRDLPQ